MKTKKSKLILKTFDGNMKKLNIKPEYVNSRVEFQIEYYNKDDIRTKATLIVFDILKVVH